MKLCSIVVATAIAVAAFNHARAQAPSADSAKSRRVEVAVTASGYTPSRVPATAGEVLTLVFKRTTDKGCGQQLVFPDRGIRRDLPLNKKVTVELKVRSNETISFTCGMGMYKGSIVASAS